MLMLMCFLGPLVERSVFAWPSEVCPGVTPKRPAGQRRQLLAKEACHMGSGFRGALGFRDLVI